MYALNQQKDNYFLRWFFVDNFIRLVKITCIPIATFTSRLRTIANTKLSLMKPRWITEIIFLYRFSQVGSKGPDTMGIFSFTSAIFSNPHFCTINVS